MDWILVWQSLWFIAIIFELLWLQNKKDSRLIYLLACSSLFYSLHYLTLSLFAAVFINALDILRNLCGVKFEKNIPVFIIFFIVYLALWCWVYLITWEATSILASIGTILALTAVFYYRGVKLRALLILSNLVWFGYNFLWNSYAGMLSDTIMMFVLIFWIHRILKKKKNSYSIQY